MKLLRLVVPILAGGALAVGVMTAFARGGAGPAGPGVQSISAQETDLSPGNPTGAEVMHVDASGKLWISQDSDPQASIREYDPATHAYTVYTGMADSNDAQLGPDGKLWGTLNDPNGALLRLDLSNGNVTTWSVPGVFDMGLAFDGSHNVWGLDTNGSGLYEFTPSNNRLCSLPLPDNGRGSFLTENNGTFWMGDFQNTRLANFDPATNHYTYWPVAVGGLTPRVTGVTFAPNGVIWFTNDSFTGTIGRLETSTNLVTLFITPSGYRSLNMDYFLGKLWFTGQTTFEDNGAVGFLDPNTATGTTPVVVGPTTTVLTPTTTPCPDAGPGLTFTAGISTGVSTFTSLALTTTVDSQGVAYAAPPGSRPSALIRIGSQLWLTDEGRNKLIQVVISTTSLYLPVVRR